MSGDPLSGFLPAVQAWFRATFGEPTPPQALGWPAIQRGEHTLILSPTGSGKTLAAFLWGIDQLYREAQADGAQADGPAASEGVRLLYISPLKALNNDVQRNLRLPLAGIRRAAEEGGTPLPRLDVLVRTGDTPSSARQQMARHPPPILITTPESLYLLLTSPVARTMFRTLRTVIVDEIHTLVGNKRGVHLALSLERAVELAAQAVQRVGLSATQRPLDEVARFLGGLEWRGQGPERAPVPRPVTVVDAGLVKPMDLQVVLAVDDFSQLPGGSVWPAIIPAVLDLVEAGRTTLIFANSRRQAERAADRLNEVWLERMAGGPGGASALGEGGAVKAAGFFGTGAVGGPFRAHHGSVSREVRLTLETALKEGRLPALVGTSSLELGIDIGSVDLVVQLQSPKGIARGLQRVGRSGHLVGQTSVGRFFVTHREDVLESAAVVRAMRQGDVEPATTPQNCLDVLAQQVVAMVAVEDWEVPALFDLVRRAYPYSRLPIELLHSVLDMLSGRYPSAAFSELRPRLAWDRLHDRLAALPGSRLLAVRNGGTIADRGSFGAYLPDRKTRLGELDEEFVYETKPGDVFTLGASTWRVQEVTEDRVVVTPAPGTLPRMPFWRGDAVRRDYHLGAIYGRFRRELAERAAADPAAAADWLQEEHALDARAARAAVDYVRKQVDALGAISSDRTVIAELFADPLGDLRLVVHSPFGARVNSPWALALAQAFREALGSQPEVMVSDDGILFRFLEADRDPPLEIVRDMGPAEARERLLAELPNSAVFGAQFRMNAARALLLPAVRGGQKRTPFWLQRLRAKDLLAAAAGFGDFPIVAETYRDCLRDVLDLEHLEQVLGAIQRGEIEVLLAETIVPSPVAAGLLFDLVAQYMYEWDQPKAEGQMQALLVGRETLAQVLDEARLPDLLRPEAVGEVGDRLQRLAPGTQARSREELGTLFLALGDLSADEAAARCSPGQGAAWLAELLAGDRLTAIEPPGGRRYVLSDHAPAYRAAFGQGGDDERRNEARRAILRRTLSTHGPLTARWLLERYGPGPEGGPWVGWDSSWLEAALAALVEGGEVAAGRITPGGQSEPEYCDRRVLERLHRATLSLLRKEVEPVERSAYTDFLTRWQHLHPADRLSGPDALVQALRQLRGIPAPAAAWERDLLALRLSSFDPQELDDLCRQGDLVWAASGGKDPRRARVRFFFRGEGHLFLPPPPGTESLSPAAGAVLEVLRAEGACFVADLEEGSGLRGEELVAALAELALAGLASADSLQALRQVVAWEGGESERRPMSSLEAELAAWREGARSERARSTPSLAGAGTLAQREGEGWAGLRRAHPGRRSLRSARMAIDRRIERAAPARGPGRWSAVARPGIWGRPGTPDERLARQARQLLQCFGVVTRGTLEADPEGGWEWAALYPHFQAMEMRGEVRRGYFVHGLPGAQFALPEAVDRLRDGSRAQGEAADELVLVNACDPCALWAWPAELRTAEGRPARLPSNYAVLHRGRPLLFLELGAGRVTADDDLPPELGARALALAARHISRVPAGRRILVREWNGQPIVSNASVAIAVSRTSPAAIVEAAGFIREALDYVWDPRP